MFFRSYWKPFAKTRRIMGSFVKITVYGRDAESIIEAAFERMHEIERQIGRDKTSDISRLNAAPGGPAIRVGNDTWRMMVLAKEYCQITEGAFDVTAGPLVDLWGFGYDGTGRFPETREIDETMRNVGNDGLILDPETQSIRLEKPGMSISVGGIAKGYAVEEAACVLKNQGVKKAIVNGGGSSIKVIGSGPPGRKWRVGIEDPHTRGGLIGTIVLKSGQALGTSADSRRFFVKNGEHYSHLIDPRTGYPGVHSISQVAVISANAAESDMLTKALFLNKGD